MDLPITFRINESYPFRNHIIEQLQTHFHYEGSIQYEGERIECIHPLTWYKDNYIWEVCSYFSIY